MKKLLALILVIMTALSALVIPTSVSASINAHGYLPGDANDDSSITMSDILIVRKYIAGIVDKKDLNFLAADVSADSSITISDVLLLRKYIAGIIDESWTNNDDSRDKVDTATVGGKNISRYSILVPSNADASMKYASKLLKTKINQACGITLNIVNDRSATEDYLIEYKLDAEDEYVLGNEGYNVKVTDDGDVVITCGVKRGALYATYYLLEKFIGYRFLADDVVYIYKASNVDLPVGFDETEVPVFEYRGLNQVGVSSGDFVGLHLNAVDARGSGNATSKDYGGGVGNLYIHGHSYAYQEAVGMKLDEANITDLDSAEAMYIFSRYGYNTHELEELDQALGLHSSQPCLCSDTTFNHIMAFNYLLYKERTMSGRAIPGHDYTMFSCSPNDTTEFCKCTDCKRVYTEEGSIAGTVFRMSNRVSEAMKEIDPEVGIYTIAYWDARNPPQNTRPDDDVCVCFCIGGCNNHTFDHLEECTGNARYPFKVWDVVSQSPKYPGFDVSNKYDIGCYTKWTELTNNIYIWYYACNFAYYISPCPNIFNIYNDYKYLASTGTIGIYTEGSEVGYTFEVLRGYLAARMMWDPLMSEEEFEEYLDEFLMIYYGDGWRYIKEYLYMQDECGNLQGCFMNNFDRPWNFYNKEYFGANFQHMLELFNNAYAEASTAAQRKRIEYARIHVYFLGLSATYESDWVNGTSAQKAAYKEKYDYLWNYIEQYGYLDKKNSSGGYDVVYDGYKCVDIGYHEKRGALNNRPASPDDVYDTMFWVNENFHGDGT